jgi:hypothetical protein
MRRTTLANALAATLADTPDTIVAVRDRLNRGGR